MGVQRTSELKCLKEGEEEQEKVEEEETGRRQKNQLLPLRRKAAFGREIAERVGRAGGAAAGASPLGAVAAAGEGQRAAAHGRSRGPTPGAAVGREGAVRHGRAAAPPRASVRVPSAGRRMRRTGPGGAPRKQSDVPLLPGKP